MSLNFVIPSVVEESLTIFSVTGLRLEEKAEEEEEISRLRSR
jgi:hypothetical protein